jgi:hypothetical protein
MTKGQSAETGMPSRTKKFQYRRRSPFLLIARLSKSELGYLDRFVELTREMLTSEKERLERLAVQIRRYAPDDDRLVDDFAELDEFAALSTEFAIIGLWRCVELYKANATRIERALARHAGTRPSQIPRRVRCATSMDELRCLNDAIKHSRRVDGELAKLPRWRRKKGRKLGHLEGHYARLRSAAEQYLNDLADRLSRRAPP